MTTFMKLPMQAPRQKHQATMMAIKTGGGGKGGEAMAEGDLHVQPA